MNRIYGESPFIFFSCKSISYWGRFQNTRSTFNNRQLKRMKKLNSKLDSSKIEVPRVSFTDDAASQIRLILENDFTLSGKYFRILISGKNCDGFIYSVGFTNLEDEDFMVSPEGIEDFEIIIDPFTAFYLHNTAIDYRHDVENDIEGFVVKDEFDGEFQGKFWRSSKESIPPLNSEYGQA